MKNRLTSKPSPAAAPSTPLIDLGHSPETCLSRYERGPRVSAVRTARTIYFARNPREGFARGVALVDWAIASLDTLPALPGRELVYRESPALRFVAACLVDLRSLLEKARWKYRLTGEAPPDILERTVVPMWRRMVCDEFLGLVKERATSSEISRGMMVDAAWFAGYLSDALHRLARLPDGNQEYFADPVEPLLEGPLSDLQDFCSASAKEAVNA